MTASRGSVLFDFDGTLADSLATVIEVFNGLSGELGIPPISADDAELRKLSPREALRTRAIPMWKVPRLMAAVRAGMRDRMDAIPPFAGTDGAIRELVAAGFRVGIVSSNARENIARFLARERLEGLEILATGSSLFGKGAMLRKVLAREGLDPSRAFYVGDEVRDVEAALDAKMRSVAVTWGYAARSALVAAKPDLLVERAAELAPRIVEASSPR